MSGGNMSDASFQQAVEEVRRKMPNVTTIVIEYLLRDCDGNVERCVNELKKFTIEKKYTRTMSYPQGMNLTDQQQAESGTQGQLSTSWSTNELRKHGTHTLHANYRYQPPKVINNQIPAKLNDVNKPSPACAGSETLEASQPMDSVDSMANLSAAQTQREQLGNDRLYPETREERLESLKKGALVQYGNTLGNAQSSTQSIPSGEETIGAQRKQLEALEKRIELLNQQTDAFKEETARKQERLMYLQSKFPSVSKTKIEEHNAVVFTLDYDVAQLTETVSQLKREVEGKWQCAHCTFLNFPLFTECEVCHFKKNTVPVWRT